MEYFKQFENMSSVDGFKDYLKQFENISQMGGGIMDYKKTLIIIVICILTLIVFASFSNYNFVCDQIYPAYINLIAYFGIVWSSFYMAYSGDMFYMSIFILLFSAMLMLMSITFKRHPSPLSPESLKGCKIPYFMMLVIWMISFLFAYVFEMIASTILASPKAPKQLYLLVFGICGGLIFLLCQIYWNWYNKKWKTFDEAFNYLWEQTLLQFFIDFGTNFLKIPSEIVIKFGNAKDGPFGSNDQ